MLHDWTGCVNQHGQYVNHCGDDHWTFPFRAGKSAWEKPEELMSDQEKATAAASAWKEHTAPDGRKYYYNKVGVCGWFCHMRAGSAWN
jgi:hypothetical protein